MLRGFLLRYPLCRKNTVNAALLCARRQQWLDRHPIRCCQWARALEACASATLTDRHRVNVADLVAHSKTNAIGAAEKRRARIDHIGRAMYVMPEH